MTNPTAAAVPIGKTNDSLSARILPTCPANVSEILHRAWEHDLAALKPLLSVPGRASVQEPTTGETPLHAAIRSCAPKNRGDSDDDDQNQNDSRAKAKDVVYELFMSGAIWNDVDSNNETPGCLADRLGLHELYQLCIEAGVRAELLFGLIDGYEELSSDNNDGDDDVEEEIGGKGGAGAEGDTKKEKDGEVAEPEDIIMESDPDRAFVRLKPSSGAIDVNSDEYLRSELTYDDGKLVDSSLNGVMMAWETSIMRASVDSLLPGLEAGKRVLNVGFGMGIIDGMFAETRPSKHHIIEAHPAVLEHINTSESKFGKGWETSGPAEDAYKVHAGKWQEVSSPPYCHNPSLDLASYFLFTREACEPFLLGIQLRILPASLSPLCPNFSKRVKYS